VDPLDPPHMLAPEARVRVCLCRDGFARENPELTNANDERKRWKSSSIANFHDRTIEYLCSHFTAAAAAGT